MKGLAFILFVMTIIAVSCETDTKDVIPEQSAKDVDQPESLPSLYSLLAQPMFRNGYDQYKNQHGHDSHEGHDEHITTKPYGALSVFKKELWPPMMVVGLIGAGLWIVASFIRSFVLSRFQSFLPVGPIGRRKREINSHIDDLTSTIMDAITKQECLEKACCELGYHSRQFQMSKKIVPVLHKVTSKPLIQAFQTGIIGKNYCEKYSCRIDSS